MKPSLANALATVTAAGLLTLGQPDARAHSHEAVDKPARVVSTLVQRAAIVEAVDPETRELKLLDGRGNRFTVVADDAVENFDQIQPRDRIIAEYLESVAVVVLPAGSEIVEGVGAEVDVAPIGELPAFEGVETVVVSGLVESINVAEREAVLLLPDGEMRTVNVSDDAPLELVAVGDEVQLRITRALAVSVMRPED